MTGRTAEETPVAEATGKITQRTDSQPEELSYAEIYRKLREISELVQSL